MQRNPTLVVLIRFAIALALALAPGLLHAAPADLAVVAVTPAGPTDRVTSVTVQFSAPMVPLGRMERAPAEVPVAFDCPLAGGFRWLNQTTLAFVLDQPLPLSTGCTVTVKAGARSLDGHTLAADHTESFETRRVKLVRSQPWKGSVNLALDPEITLTFNQPVMLASLGESLGFNFAGGTVKARVTEVPGAAQSEGQGEGEEGNELPVDAARSYIVRPSSPLPRDTPFTLVIPKGLRSTFGPLPSDEEKSLEFRTYGPLRVVRLGCNDDCRPQCDPDGPLVLELSTPVGNRAARKLVRILAGRAPRDAAASETAAPPDEDLGAGVSFEGEVTSVYLPGPWQPRSRVTLEVPADLTDSFGQKLGAVSTHTADIGARWPIHDLGGRFGVFESGGDHRFPLLVRNVPDLVLRTRLLARDEIIPFLRDKKLLSEWDGGPVDPLAGMSGVKATPLGPWGKADVATHRPLDLDRMFDGKATSGLLYLDVSSDTVAKSWTCDKKTKLYDKTLLQVTDIGLSVKFGEADTLVLASSLARATPLPGTRIELRGRDNQVLAAGETGADGVVVLPGKRDLLGSVEPGDEWNDPVLWVFAERGGELAFVHANWRRGIEPWAFGLPYDWPGGPDARAHTVTDSPIYRPGDRVRFRTLVRRLVPNGLGTPAGESLSVVVSDSQGEKVHEQTGLLSAYGSIHGEFALASGAHLGSYRVTAKLAGKEVSAGEFLVEEYRPSTIKLEVEEAPATATAAGHLPGDCAAFGLRARYYFGGAVGEGEASYTLASGSTWVSIAALQGFEYGQPYREKDEYRPPASLDLGRGALPLGRDGTAGHELELPAVAEPQAISFEATLKDASGRPVSARAGFTLHPSDLYLGLRPKDWGVAAGGALSVDLLATDASGAIAPGTAVEIDILRRVWNVVRRKGVGSFYTYENSVEDQLVDHLELDTWDIARSFTARPALAGTYLVRARARDAAGRAAESVASFYAWGGDVAGFERYDHDRIDLVPDKESYLPGEVAKVLVKSPFEQASVWLTIERAGVERYETTCISGSAALLEVPIFSGDAPTVFVSAMLERGRVEERPGTSGVDLGKPQVRVGYATLNVRDPGRKLAVEVKPGREEYRPGDEVEVALRVPGLGGERAELTVLALDEAVLDVVGHAPWDPFAVFYAPRPLGVSTADTRLQIVGRRHFGQKGEAVGGGGGAAGDSFRRDFRASAYFAADVETGGDGLATVRFRLPDNLTTFRIVALAATRGDRFGAGEARILVTKPVVTSPSVARFLESGDRAEIGIVVNNRTGQDGVAEVALEARGVTVESPATTRAAIAAGTATETLFTVKARGEGEARLRFTTALGRESDALEWKLKIEDRAPIDVYATYGSFADSGVSSRSVAVKVPEDARTDRGGLEVALSSSLAGGLRGPIDWMQRYPYDCLEQRLSKAIAFATAARYPGRIGLAADDLARDRAYVGWVLGELGQFQDPSGAFAYWPGTLTDPYLTGYVLWTTRVLGEWGFTVDAERRARGLEAAAQIVREDLWPWWYSEACKREVRAFLLAVLGRDGKLETALLDRSAADRDQTSLFGVAALLDAAGSLRGPGRAAYDQARRVLLGRAGVTSGDYFFEEVVDDGLRAVLGSPVRGNAMALLAFAAREPDWPNLAPLMRFTMFDEKAGRWDTTHEIAWGMMAAAAYLDAYEKETPSYTVKASLDGKPVGDTRFDGFESKPIVATRAAADLVRGKDAALRIEKDGPGRLYYALRLRVASLTDNAQPVNSGLQVERRYERGDGAVIAADAAIARGELVRVVVTLTAPSLRHFVVVDDPLPAGFEAVNFRLATTARGEAAAQGEKADNGWIAFEELRDDRAIAYTRWVEPGAHTFTYLARATTAGRFLAPAPHAEEMYSPETYGRGRPRTVTVRSAEPIAAAEPKRSTGVREEMP